MPENESAVALLSENTTTLAGLASAYAGAGQTDRAREILERMRALANRKYVPAYDMAIVHTALGNTGEALACMQRAYDERDGGLWLRPNVDPRVDSLRGESRFRALLANMHLPQ